MTLIGGVFGFVINHANAEMIIHSEPSSQIKTRSKSTSDVNTQAVSSQPYNTQFIDNPLMSTRTPTEVSIVKLMQVMHIDEQITAIVNGQHAAVDAINTQTSNIQTSKRTQQSSADKVGDKKLNKRQLELQTRIQGLLGQYTKILTGSIDEATDIETMTAAYMSAAKAYYTQAEVDAQIKFYDTAIGQSILAKQPQVTAEFLKQSLPEDMDATKDQLNELLPQMKRLMKDIL
ncbi:DUF2059 domain-containing protein [Psychrobacter frigidicola]|uniref:DUF2059 domain-containing protein n=2 Tax=Psychrobacter frigidicola TaxID=45611 RepID=A0A5C7A5V7_9GAMM|nr:DUF2059 domain-containing protein [Psychrobacter frigidicola]